MLRGAYGYKGWTSDNICSVESLNFGFTSNTWGLFFMLREKALTLKD